MAQNKNALIRYKTIDKCLQNKYRKWTLEDLIDACSDALNEYEGRDINVSKRSVQLDIQLMRTDKLGYNAPIVVYDKKYYRYEDENFSITNIPLTETDMNVLSETVEMLKQFKDFSLFSELDGIIQRLEDKIYTEKTTQPAIIHLDKNENLKGLQYLDTLYQAILKKICLNITYQSFKARASSDYVFHPYILKQFNNRWFLVGRQAKQKQILTLALDRITNIEYNLDTPYLNENFNGDEFYKNTIGVTVLNDDQLQEIELQIDRPNAPYVITKPFHHSQKVVGRLQDGSVIISLKVHLNFEFDRLILGFGDSIKVLKPRYLKNRIKRKLKRALEGYDNDVNNDKIKV
ncbi:helix-turn-helix transcriptional regulator [Brumimicrobium mesophilum]|uniref:helix-turn-helix transcriptional regulator n=1 Tax=Brumimicrobium mesophilum TaxID=392717 RepID=UPI000D1401A3|nr:WYL domain-containing protein [Brumimicrobium mesophilum]